MKKRQKQVIPYAELLEKIRSLLIAYPECINIHVDGIQVLREHSDGANWYVVNYRCSGDKNDLYACREKILPEIRQLRESYDVEHA